MTIPAPAASLSAADPSDLLAGDCRGMNFYRADPALQALLDLYLPPALREHLEPHLERLGELAGGRIDELAAIADKNPPVLHNRDRLGRDEDWIEYHPAYCEMERIAFGEYGLHAMSHRGGVLGWPEPLPPVAKYALQYLFVQGEFGLMCPVSVTDTSIRLIRDFASPALRQRLLPRMLSQDMETMLKGTQFITEKAGGSDVGALQTEARLEGGQWRLYGEKWFCSHADADVAMLLARPQGAAPGTRGLALFILPRRLENSQRNAYRIARLKDKLGTRSMASGEIRLEGAQAYLVGEPGQGFKQMLSQVNLSRLSHGVRAAAMMRRCLNESLQAARTRHAFGRPLIAMPLMRRQLGKIMLPTEQALSVAAYSAYVLGQAEQGDAEAAQLLRMLTPLLKFRACRDNVRVATGAMEVRGGNGYIEDWVNARLVRDAHIGVIWEGTSNINALDVIQRAVGKEGAQRCLAETLRNKLAQAGVTPPKFRQRLATLIERSQALAGEVAQGHQEPLARQAAGALYHVTSAVLMAWEASRAAAQGGDARRLLLARLVVEHRLSPQDPLALREASWETQALELLLGNASVSPQQAVALVDK